MANWLCLFCVLHLSVQTTMHPVVCVRENGGVAVEPADLAGRCIEGPSKVREYWMDEIGRYEQTCSDTAVLRDDFIVKEKVRLSPIPVFAFFVSLFRPHTYDRFRRSSLVSDGPADGLVAFKQSVVMLL